MVNSNCSENKSILFSQLAFVPNLHLPRLCPLVHCGPMNPTSASINLYPTIEYSQPSEYRFSHDSVFLARQVFDRLKHRELSQLRGLDIGAGCGIVGLDFLFHCKNSGVKPPLVFDFLEIQDIYKTHFEFNYKQLRLKNTKARFLLQNYRTLQESSAISKYDLILSNPPYFRLGTGALSPSQFKNRCRFFMDGTFEELIFGIRNSLAPSGEAYLLIKELSEHNLNHLELARRLIGTSFSVKVIDHIRGTPLVLVKSLVD